MNDDELIERLKCGDKTAAEEMIKQYYPAVLRYCRWHCSAFEPAEDLTQETFLKLFKGLDGYKAKGRFKAYLYSIAYHVCVDEGRRSKPYTIEDEEIADDSRDMLQIEDNEEINYLLSHLSGEQKEAVILRFGEGLSFKEIGAVTGCSLRTAQSRVRNGLLIMRKVKENEGQRI